MYCSDQNLNSEIDCFHSQAKTFGFLENNYPNSGIALLVVLIGELSGSFNIGKNMSASQVIDTAKMILQDYSELKIDDVALCFCKAKKGQYGKIYDRLDSAIIFGWLEMFLAEKHEQIEYYWKHQQLAIKQENQNLLIAPADIPVADDKALEYIRKIRKDVLNIQRRNFKAKNVMVAKPIEQNIIQKVHEEFMIRFKNLYEIEIWADPSRSSGQRFVTCCGKRLDIGEYIQKKHMQLINYYRKVNYYFGIVDYNYPAYKAPPMPDFNQYENEEFLIGYGQ